jgi:hypothetical protein
LLLLICLPVFIFKFRLISPLGAHLLAVAAGFILFCGYLRFQPWHSRLHLGYFLLAAPFIGVVLVSWCDRWIIALTGCFLMTNVILVLVFNPVVPIVASVAGRESREDLYFGTRTDLRAPMKALADDIIQSGCTNVLLKVGGDSWEYPVWFLLRDRGFTGSIHHTLVGKKATAFLDESPLPPKTVIVTELEVAPVIESLPRQKAYGDWAVYYRP